MRVMVVVMLLLLVALLLPLIVLGLWLHDTPSAASAAGCSCSLTLLFRLLISRLGMGLSCMPPPYALHNAAAAFECCKYSRSSLVLQPL
jgi:hypothetical protein